MLGFIKRNCASVLNRKALKLLYLALVRSHFSFTSQVWGHQLVIVILILLENAQRRVTRFICKENTLAYK